MLKFFTRLEKTRNFVLLLFAILMVGSLVFFYTPSPNTFTANLSQSEETVASVDGHAITIGEVVRQKENYSQFSRQSFPTKSILDGLIGSRITRVEAERLGLTASNDEVAAEILKQNKPTDGKPFDKKTYERNVTEMYGNIAAYEQSVRDDVSARKLEAFLTAGVTVSEAEVLEDFQRRNGKFDVSYVAVTAADLAEKVVPTDAELRDYFEKNKSSYYISVPQKKIKYVFINQARLGEKLSIPEADIRAEFDALTPDKKLAGVLGREIVLRVPKPEQDSQIQAKAGELVAQLRKDAPTVTEEAFSTTAKGQSENPATAGQGGKLAGPVRENPNKADDPYQRLLKMKPGEISEPISYQGRYFILWRGADVPKTFETARKEIEVSLRNRRAYTAAAELAQKVADSLKQTKDPAQTAQSFAAEAGLSATEMVRETDFVKPGDDVPNIGVSSQFEAGIEPLANVGDVGEKTPITGGFAVPVLVDKKEPRDATFEEVKDKISVAVKAEKARTEMEAIAKQLAEAGSPAALKAAAAAKGLDGKDKKDFVLGSPLGEGASAGTNKEIEDAIYALKEGDVTKTPFKIGDTWFVVGMNKRTDADTAEFAKQRTSLTEQMLTQKRAQVFADYITALKQRMEAEGRIKVYNAAVEKIDAPLPGALPEEDV